MNAQTSAASMATAVPSHGPIRSARNAGPEWGPRFLVWSQRTWPRWIFRPALMLGTWVALLNMSAQRRHSRAYLSIVLGRPARLLDAWRHFFAFMDFLMLKLRTGAGAPLRCELAPENADAFETLLRSDEP